MINLRRPFSRRIAAVFGALVFAASPIARSQPGRATENVVLLTLDGVRWQEVFTGLDADLLRSSAGPDADLARLDVYKRFNAASPGERRERLMPFFWKTLVTREGSIAGNRPRGSLMNTTNQHWFSYPGYSEILTGQAHDDVIKSNDAIRNPFPSVLQFVKRELKLSTPQVATFASWAAFSGIAESVAGETTVNAGVQASTSTSDLARTINRLQSEIVLPWDGVRQDALTFHLAMDHLARARPRLLYISFDETDEWSHDGKYDRLLMALNQIDRFIETLWTTLQADAQYRGHTTLIVTVDHGRGRGAKDWRNHGHSVPGADELWLAIASPDVPLRGEWQGHPPIFQNQVAGTIAKLLGLDYRKQNAQAGAAIDFAAKVPARP